MKFFQPNVRLINKPKAARVCIRSTNQSNHSISVRLFVCFVVVFFFCIVREFSFPSDKEVFYSFMQVFLHIT